MSENEKQELYRSDEEDRVRRDFVKTFRECPIPEDDLMSNLGLFLNSKSLARILFMHHIYTQIVDVPGVIMDFGTRWGQTAALFAALRGIYEPFNRHRKIAVFDTFSGFPEIDEKDGASSLMREGSLAVPADYEAYLEEVLTYHEQDNPISHIKKFEIRPGDATRTIHEYLGDNPETIVALAYFDFDLYEPTRECLEAIQPRLVKGSVLGFDELNDPDSPGETAAVMETLGLNNIRLKRFRYASRVSYFVVE